MSALKTHFRQQKRQGSASNSSSQTTIVTSGLAALIITILFLLAFFSLQSSQKQAKVSEKSLENLEQEIKQLETDLEHSRQASANSQTQLAREKIIRNELLGQKPGEIILQVPEREPTTQFSSNSAAVTTGPLEKWRELLLGSPN